ncbi:Rieske 2Fe-2S domain-containing protein [Mycolicibacterium vanbaalenii]|uniref:Rieske (2Fe-2S) domain protein n=1 Tax=Mycolicibacterium vanbaalenii (strain DSM 7251 / JCM 13017 / BCRC 16820 / KCTC 9966 / NRRL B-24157 / PYR-1) TaxID=350058 RepID=A1T3T9_MYCVP|nr:Rieske 2Fe-2S domain-containing protein [Mycolicibacterium vanbaalenii]ABM11839.1 Rieske (2Fe-2S) domain protein [Mycolicibacterium vanbaalenii PYR-1]MCV7127951.1 Rieske 2Fe-2S domain-containing protein [Mycolicibacterium vanbaalenii PYR-1]
MNSLKDPDFEHTGPGRPAGHLLRQRWQPVYASEELEAGRAVPLKILHEELTLYRGEDGVAHIVAGRCAHRGVLLAVGTVEGDCVRCRYHGWRYDGAGQCVDQPAERRSFADKVRIASYPVEEYFGFIWTYLGESPVPELPRWPELEEYGRFHVIEHRKWNYFHDLENTVDDVHQYWVHKTGIYQDDGNAGQIPEMSAELADFGLTQTSTFSNGFVRRLALLMPNTLYFNSGAGVLRGFKSFLWNVPIDDENHMMFFLFIAAHLPPDVGARLAAGVREGRKYLSQLRPVDDIIRAVLSGRERWEDIEDRPDQVLIEDGVVLLGQGVLPDRSLNRLGSSDAAIILLRRLYARELAAIEAGHPLTKFPTPDAAALTRLDSSTP